MSILIKGMEMPRSCSECRFFVDAWCYAFKADDWRNAYNKPPNGERLDNYPLVPVPPHGRLIDADALIDKVIAKYLKFEREGKLVFAAAEIKQDIVDLISDAPTIIEAEEGET